MLLPSIPKLCTILLLWWQFFLMCTMAKLLTHAERSGSQRFAMEPQDQTAIVGSRVTLPCRVLGKNGMLQWTKDDFGLGTHRNLSGFERYSMVGSDEEGDFSLDIYPVMLDDDAKYQCQVGPSPTGKNLNLFYGKKFSSTTKTMFFFFEKRYTRDTIPICNINCARPTGTTKNYSRRFSCNHRRP